jgi:tetratricopeptide (TPR) repeat protein
VARSGRRFRTAQTWVFEGETDRALEVVRAMSAVTGDDEAQLAGDLNLMGNILLEAGRTDEALARFEEAIAVSDESATPDDARAAFRRNALFNTARVALARGDLDQARSQAAEYAAQVAVSAVPFEQWQSHQLNGLIALTEEEHAAAVEELRQANALDPRVQYLLAQAYEGTGNRQSAREACRQAAEHNGLNFNYAYVRAAARRMLAEG